MIFIAPFETLLLLPVFYIVGIVAIPCLICWALFWVIREAFQDLPTAMQTVGFLVGIPACLVTVYILNVYPDQPFPVAASLVGFVATGAFYGGAEWARRRKVIPQSHLAAAPSPADS